MSPNLPPKNPYLADSNYPIAHGTSAQQTSISNAGPSGPSRKLSPAEIDYAPVGPAHFGACTSSPYPDGRRVIWSNGIDRIVKIDHDTFEVLWTYPFPDTKQYSENHAERSIRRLNRNNEGLPAIVNALLEARKLTSLSGLYTLVDVDGVYYIVNKDGLVTAFGDAQTGNPASAIEKKREFQLPAEVSGLTVGLNMTFDGWLIVATEHGYIAAVKRDFSDCTSVRLRHSEGAEDKATGPTGYGWIRNVFAIDTQGGIYIASQDHMHKVVWTGQRLSTDETDGAWTARYFNETGNGTGATPSLMGFGDEDRFVVITDGSNVMNMTLFWRDEIPDDWQQLPGAPDRRIAGMTRADMDNPEIEEIQTEQSVVVAGYQAMVVNNIPRNTPQRLPGQIKSLLAGYLGSNPKVPAIRGARIHLGPRTVRTGIYLGQQ